MQDLRRKNKGAPRLLSDAELLWLARAIRADQEAWNGLRVQQEIAKEFGKQLYLGRCYEILQAVGYSLQRPRPQHVEADPIAQEEFKKNSSQRLSKQLKKVLKELDGL